MGNRAVIAFTGASAKSKCIYLHWNGGRASVEGFLQAVRALKINPLDRKWGLLDEKRAIEQFAKVVGPFFFGNDPGMTIYVEEFGSADKDNYDNGLYWISEDFYIVGRKFTRGGEEVNPEKTTAICEQILARAPVFND